MIKPIPMILLLLAAGARAQVLTPGLEGDCGFSDFEPRRMSHFIREGTIRKVTPEYPPIARAKGLAGVVRVRILVNKEGLVERTCLLYAKDESLPDRSLVVAAEFAAFKWAFVRNFGLQTEGPLLLDYVDDILVFRFDPTGLE